MRSRATPGLFVRGNALSRKRDGLKFRRAISSLVWAGALARAQQISSAMSV
jgi:hypothetical protein